MSGNRAAIKHVTSHLPAGRLTNEQLAREFGDRDAGKVLDKTGIAVRRVAAAGECASDMGVAAARHLLEGGACSRDDIDFLLFCTQSVQTYFPQTFAARCVNYAGEVEVVETHAHDMRRVVHDVPRFMKTYVPEEICRDLVVNGMKFFRADARKLFGLMPGLAREGMTVYPRSVYSRKFPAKR